MTELSRQTLWKTVPLDRQSVILEGEERIHVSHKCNHQDNEYTIDRVFDDVNTVYDALLRGERVSNDGPCLGVRASGMDPYNWITYSEIRLKAQQFGSALLQKGFEASNESKVGIYSQNRPEWVIADFGCITFSMLSVPLYSTLGPEGYEYIINLTEMRLIVVDTLGKVDSLLDQNEKLPTLKHIVVMETPVPESIRDKIEMIGVEVVTFEDFLELGKTHLAQPTPGKPDDIVVIRFTSGTTGVPKGAMISHANIISNLAGSYASTMTLFSYKPGARCISYLPLAHGYEHTVLITLLMFGCSVGFFRGDLKELLNDMQALKPDVFPCVPRLANKLHDKIMSGVNSSSIVKRALFNWALKVKQSDVERGIIRKDTWWDKLVFQKLQLLLGGRVQWIITGSAPISGQVLLFMRAVFGCTVSEPYGQTEATCGATITLPGETDSGHVGPPMPSFMVKLVDVEEMGYLAAEDKGEICMKGPCVFKGYYKNPEKTAEAIDEDGWLHSGDIGEWLPNGALKIIDRKKNIYKLSQGEYVAPEKVENVVTRSSLIMQAFVYGDSLKSCNIAILIPEEEELLRLAENNNISGTMAELCENEIVRKVIQAELDKTSQEAKLCGFEKVKAFLLYPEPFSVENGLLTPTFKNKRAFIKRKFEAEFKQLYSNLD